MFSCWEIAKKSRFRCWWCNWWFSGMCM